MEVNRDAEPPDRDRDRGGGGGEAGGGGGGEAGEHRRLDDRQGETGTRSKTTNGMRGATPATSSPSEASPSGVSNNSPTDISAEEARNNLSKKVNDLRNPRNLPDFLLLEVPFTFLQMEAARHKDFRILNVGVGSLS